MAIHIGRRDFITLLGGAAAWPLAARGQQGERARRIGVLMPESEDKPESQARAVAFERRLPELGWMPVRNLQIDYRWGMGEVEKARAATAALLKLTPSVLIAVASPATAAMQRTTRTIRIVFVAVSEPVAQGFVASLAHPGGNLTGFTHLEPTFGAKWLDPAQGNRAESLARRTHVQRGGDPSSRIISSVSGGSRTAVCSEGRCRPGS